MADIFSWAVRLAAAVAVAGLTAALHGSQVDTAADQSQEAVAVNRADWEYFAVVPLPAASGETPLVDMILGPEIFSQARPDLADLRLFQADGQTYPYALRVLRPENVKVQVSATEFNRTAPENGPRELTLDLQSNTIEYNEIRIATSGTDFRRAVEVDASDDAQTWRNLVDSKLLRFASGDQSINVDAFEFPPSRMRYIRVRVHPDPNRLQDPSEEDSFVITEATVYRHVELPGERSTNAATLETRQPTRVDGSPGSSWIIDLGGDNIPCDRIEVEVSDAEFVRDIRLAVDYGTRGIARPVFTNVAIRGDSFWQRQSDDPKEPLVIEFDEVQASRLMLMVADYGNPPLSVQSARYSAAARQVVFARPPAGASQMQLYFGNPEAESPNYDFARNLAENLEPPPQRTELQPAQQNPEFVPPPQPLTERWPWLIYVVLGSVSLVLGGMILSLSRAAIGQTEPSGGEAGE